MPNWKPEILRRLAPLTLAPTREAEIAEELAQHLDDRYQELVASGQSEDAAFRIALDELKGEDLLARSLRPVERSFDGEPVAPGKTAGNLVSGITRDVRYSFRNWVRNPAFFLFAMGVLALGIGANTAIFTVAYNILLRPLPYRDASRLVMIWEDDSAFGFPKGTPPPGNYAAWRLQNDVFTGMAALHNRRFDLTGHGNPEQLLDTEITANMFSVLGAKPALGRNLLPSEDKPGANQVVILSHPVWMTNFGGDSQIVGKQITLNGANYTVIGVMPRGFIFPDRLTQIWTPIGLSDKDLANRTSHYLHVIARLKPGVSLKTANADLAVVAQNLAKQFPDTNAKVGAYAVPLRERLTGNSRTAAVILVGAVGFVLLIACANVANLLLARAAGRQKEMAMRMALGARPGRIIRQLLTESILLSVMAGGAGLLLAIWVTPFLAHLVPEGLVAISGSGINGIVLAFLIGILVVCGVLFGLAPALRVSRLDLIAVIKQGGAQSGVGAGGRPVRDLLVIAEVALALMLFSGATLMVRSFVNVGDLDPGFRPAHVLTADIELPSPKYDDTARRNAFFEQVLDRINHLPGVVAAGCTTWLPLTQAGGASAIVIEGHPAPGPGHEMIPNVRMISDKYVQAIGMRLIAGRNFDERDSTNTALVALVNQAAAKSFWGSQDPMSARFEELGSKSRWITVVGIVGDVRQAGLDQPPRPEIYFPYQQWDYFYPGYVAVRTTGDPMALANAVREQIWAVDKDQPVTAVMPLETMLEDYLAPRELQSSLLGGFAGFALLLAALGIYAVLAFSVAQRTQEIGVRVALGAQQSDILRQILAQGMQLAGFGVAIGVAGALALSHLLSSLLFGVSATDLLTLGGAVFVLLAVAVAACFIPARRAMRVDPLIALRYD
jgi:putative ABC transport system permease protein